MSDLVPVPVPVPTGGPAAVVGIGSDLATVVRAAGVVPPRVTDPAAARVAYDQVGAAVLVAADPAPWARRGPDEPVVPTAELRRLLAAVFGDRLRHVGDPVAVRATGGKDRPDLEADGHLVRTGLHTDGFALADGAPDVLVLACAHASARGGDSFLADIAAAVAALSASPSGAALAQFLGSQPVDQTEPGKHPSIGPIGIRRPDGTVAWRRSIFVRPSDDDPDPDATRAALAAWDAVLAVLDAGLPRFRLESGDVLLADNTRLFHGRDPYDDRDRLLWRQWAWSDRAVRPDVAYPTSDTSRVSVR